MILWVLGFVATLLLLWFAFGLLRSFWLWFKGTDAAQRAKQRLIDARNKIDADLHNLSVDPRPAMEVSTEVAQRCLAFLREVTALVAKVTKIAGEHPEIIEQGQIVKDQVIELVSRVLRAEPPGPDPVPDTSPAPPVVPRPSPAPVPAAAAPVAVSVAKV